LRVVSRRSVSRRLFADRWALAAAIFLAFTTAVALLAPLLANERPIAIRDDDGWSFPVLTKGPVRGGGEGAKSIPAPIAYSPDAIDLTQRLVPPSSRHLLGTDELGRDVLSRMIHGSRVSITVGLVATVIALLVGTLLGALAGYYRGGVDWIVSRLIEVVLCFPFLVLLLAIVAVVGPSLTTIVVALGLTSWPQEARLVRGEILRLRELSFTDAARAAGARDLRIVLRHLLPNAIAPVIVSASFGVGSVIMIESALSFLGFGVPLPTPSWGSILSSASTYIAHAWWLALFPGIAIFLTVASCNLIGERLRDVLDPATGAE
jgi:peptide/nickel transport system permease protein